MISSAIAWVLKPALGRVGDGVGIRGVTPDKEWGRIARAARWFPRWWIAQRRFEASPLDTGTELTYPCIGVYTIDGCAAAGNVQSKRIRAAARSAAGGKNLEILGADVAAQCLQRGLVDEILVYVLPVLLGDGVRFSPPSLDRIDLEPFSNTQSGAITMLRFRVPPASSVF